jgi:hypothetical protein
VLSTVGGLLMCCGLALTVLFISSPTILFYVGGSFCTIGSYTMLLMVQPTFRKVVRWVTLSGILVCFFAFRLSLTSVSNDCGGFTSINATENVAACLAGRVLNFGDVILYSSSWIALLACLRITKRAGTWHVVMSPRANLNRMWTVMLILCSVQGIMQTAGRTVQIAQGTSRSPVLVFGGYLFSASFLLCGVLCTSSVRSRIQACLRGSGGSAAEETSAAAGISALLGGVDSNEALKLGLRSFRALPASALTQQHLAASTAAPELHAKTRQVAVGECDFFLSHSWSDEGDAKWQALQSVLQEEAEAHKGREMLLWLECVRQRSSSDRMTTPSFPSF